jgi:hypothetical protein
LIRLFIDDREQGWKARAVLEAQSTSVAKVVDAIHLATEVGLVEVFRMGGVIGNRHWRPPEEKREEKQHGPDTDGARPVEERR